MPPPKAAPAACQSSGPAGYERRLATTFTARKEFAIRAGLDAVGQFERDHGMFDAEEVSAAEEWAATALERARGTGSSTRRRTA